MNGTILKCDMHVHSNYSSDATNRVQDIVRLWEKKGILPIVCDHNCIDGSFDVYREIRKRNPDIPMILAEEILSSEGEIIGLFLNEEIPPYLSAAETLDRIRGQGGLSIIPHPFSTQRCTAMGHTILNSIIRRVDIIEGYNGKRMRAGENQMASEYAIIHKKPVSVGSDAHSPPELGGCFLNIGLFDGPGEFIRNLDRPSFHTIRKLKISSILLQY